MRFTDQIGHRIDVPTRPVRIVSLVPSQTELLFDLGLDEEVIGITKFCVHPKTWFRTKQRVGGTKTPKLDLIESLKPDLILANKEENRKEDIEHLLKIAPVWCSDILSLEEAFEMIRDVGQLVGKANASIELIGQIKEQFRALQQFKPRRALYFIWKDPLMVAGKGTFIDSVLAYAGFENAAENLNGRYPEITAEEVNALSTDVLLFSSEPFPFTGKHMEEMRSLFDAFTCLEVDGELFSWYGSRLLKTPEHLAFIQNQL